MGRIIVQILKALRFVFSRFERAFSASLVPDKDQQLKGQPASTIQGSHVRVSDQTIHVGSVTEGETDPKSVGTETPDSSVEEKQQKQNAGAGAIGGASPEGDGEGGAVPGTIDGVCVAGMESDPTRHTLQMGVSESTTEELLGNDEMTDVPPELNIAGSEIGPRRSSPHDETCNKTSASRTVRDDGMSNRSRDRESPVHLEYAGVGDSCVDYNSVQEDALQVDAATSCPDPHLHLEVPNLPITAIADENAGERTTADASADASATNPTGLPNEGLRGREVLPEMPRIASECAATPDSGSMVRSLSEKDPQKSTEDDLWAIANDGKTSPPRQPIPREDAHEYAVDVQDVSTVDREYARWNKAIVEQLLLAGPPSEGTLLCVNPRVLARVFEEANLGIITPEQAEQQFTGAVANIYQRRVLRHNSRLRVLRRCSGDGPPDCAAFLAGSVLAAFRMQSDEEASGNAYYRRLAVLLKCEMRGAHPIGFDPPVFESLWVFLRNWLSEAHGRQLAMPKNDIGFRRFVAMALAHVPLRSLDIEKLPVFFSWAKYEPRARVRYDRLLADLKRWQQSRNMLTPTGAGALYDDRSSAVSAQVSAELEGWDGSLRESPSRRSALVEIQFDVVQRSPVFFYLPRRPPGFPRVFDGGERVFEASDDGWYDPAPLRPEDGEILESGFEWHSHANGIDCTLRRSGAQVVPFTPSSGYSGFLSRRRLLRGVRCSVLCRDNIVTTVKDYLSEVAQSLLNPTPHPQLPNGWSMFRDFSARIHIEAPAGLEALEVDPNVELIFAGGLRIGRSWSWLAEAPPRILVSGVEAYDCVKVNGVLVGVGAGGELLAGELFAEPGEYLIEAGSLRRRIEIEQPKVSVQSPTKLRQSLDASRSGRIALPHGSWTLIGNSPDQVCYSHGEFFRGTIVSFPFYPSWAIQVGAGPGAVVAVVAHPSPPRMPGLRRLTGQAGKLMEQWSSVVYAAHIRRPRFIGLNGAVPDEAIVDIWKNYAALAKEIKRRMKKTR